MFGYPGGSLVGRSIDVLIPEDVREIHAEELGRYLEQARPRAMGIGIDLRGIRSDGVEFPLEISLNPVRVGRQTMVLALVCDISERTEMERRARRTQKMDAISRFAAGIVGEFDPVLSVLSGRNGGAAATSAALSRALFLIQQLRMIGGAQSAGLEWFDINRQLSEMLSSLSAIAGESIRVEFTAGSDTGELLADRRQVEYVVVSLVQNARDAMPDGGRITVESASVELDENDAGWFMAVNAGPHIMITVAAAGKRFTADPERLLEPFFSSKMVGDARGLRLSTVYGTLKSAGGNIRLPGPLKQHAFKVVFPRIGSIGDPSPGFLPTASIG